MDGFGRFSMTIEDVDGFKAATTQVTLALTNMNGTPWNTAGDVRISNGTPTNALAAGHVSVVTFDSTSQTYTNTGATGYAANGGAVSVPKPAPIALALTGLAPLGIVGLRRLRRRSVVSA